MLDAKTGIGSARRRAMGGVRRVEDLEAYKLAVEVRKRVFRLTQNEPAASDVRFVSQIRDAARGGTRNISEGYSRLSPNEFRRYLTYARSSLNEVADELEDGFDSDYFSEAERNEVRRLIDRANGAIARLMDYLDSPTAHRWYEAHKKRRALREWEKPAPNENPNENENPNPNENPE